MSEEKLAPFSPRGKRRPAPPIDIETDSPSQRRKFIIALTWPALAENVLSSLVSMVDTIMVSGLGSYAISAVGLVTQPRFIMLSVFIALNVGCTALVARFRGMDDREAANATMRHALLLTAVLSVALCGLMLLVNEPLIRFIAGSDLSEQTVQAGIGYFRIQLYGFLPLALCFSITAALRGIGNTRAAFYVNTVSNLVNVFFNYCLIGGNLGFPALGVEGASIATVIGQVVAFALAIRMLTRRGQFISLDLKKRFRPSWMIIRRILNIGIPAMIEQLIMRVAMMIYTLLVTRLGDVSYAAHIVASNIQQLSFSTGMSFGTAATTLTGQTLGRKRPDLSRLYMRQTQMLGLIVSFAVAAFLFFLGRPVSSLYTADPTILDLSSFLLKLVAVMQPFQSMRFVYTAGLRGAGDARYTALITFVGMLLVRPALAVLFIYGLDMGLTGAWLALVLDNFVTFAMALCRFRQGKWAHIRV